MKAKKLMGMIACAGACVSLSSFANTTNDWFGVTVGVDIVTSRCTTNGVAVTVENNKIKLDNDKDTPLTITPDASFAETNKNDGVYVNMATAALTPCSASDLADNVTDGAKAGFAVGVDGNDTNYYGYAKGTWTKYPNATVVDEGADTTFKIVLNYRDGKVEFYAGENAATKLGEVADVSFGTSAPIGIDAFGSGSISSVTSKYEVAVAAVQNGDKTLKYGSAVEAVKAANGGTVLDIDANGEATPNKQAQNGLYAWQCEILGIENDAQIALTNNGIIEDGGKTYIKLANAAEVPEGVSVTFNVKNGSGDTVQGACAADAIKIPLETGSYTVEPVISAASGN